MNPVMHTAMQQYTVDVKWQSVTYYSTIQEAPVINRKCVFVCVFSVVYPHNQQSTGSFLTLVNHSVGD